MDKLLMALAPAFAAALAMQKIIEVLDNLLGGWAAKSTDRLRGQKTAVLGVLGFVLSIVVAIAGEIRVFKAIASTTPAALDVILTALIISGGTEGVNSVIKFLGYAKENKKAEASAQRPQSHLPPPKQYGPSDAPP